MSDTDTTLESGLQAANPDNSTVQGQGNSFDPAKFRAELLAEFRTLLKDDNSLRQSMKDTVIADVRKDKGMKAIVDEYRKMKADGMTDREIDQELRFRELQAQISSTQSAPVLPGTQNASGTEVTDLADTLGLDLRDPKIAQIAAGADPVKGLIAHAKSLKQSPPSAAALSQPASAPLPPNVNALTLEYKNKALAARGNRDAIRAIQAEYAAKGVPVETVDLMAP